MGKAKANAIHVKKGQEGSVSDMNRQPGKTATNSGDYK